MASRRTPEERVGDIVIAVDRCLAHASQLGSVHIDTRRMARDAVSHNLTVIGEAVRGLPEEMLERTPHVPWGKVRGLRNRIVHEYFRIDEGVIADLVARELRPFAVQSLAALWQTELDRSLPHRTSWNDVISSVSQWYWTDTHDYLDWLQETLDPRICEREESRLRSVLSDDLEVTNRTPWSLLYDSADAVRDADSDYHYFNQAPMSLGSDSRYDVLWLRYTALWHEYNTAGRVFHREP